MKLVALEYADSSWNHEFFCGSCDAGCFFLTPGESYIVHGAQAGDNSTLGRSSDVLKPDHTGSREPNVCILFQCYIH